MYGRTSHRNHQRGSRLPPVFLAGDSGGGWRMVPGLFGFQSQTLPYLILGVGGMGHLSRSSVSISVRCLSVTVVSSCARANALNNTHAGLATAVIAALFSPTSC